MRLLLVIFTSFLLFIFPILLIAGEYSAEDQQYKKANIDKLKPYGPGFNEDQRPIWKQMMKIYDEKGVKSTFDCCLPF